MWWLRTLFRAREALQIPAGNDAPRPLIEHMEELRRTLLRMGGVLLAAMLLSFFFTPTLMRILRHPVDQVWSRHEAGLLPEGISPAQWGEAKALADTMRWLPPDAAEALAQRTNDDVLHLARAVPYLQGAALLSPAAKQQDFLRGSTPQELLPTVLALYDSGADLRPGRGREALKLMGAFQPAEAFMLSLNLAFFSGLILSFPVQLYLLMRFIVPGLLENEKRLLFKAVSVGCLLFLGGCAFAYFAVLPRVLLFFYDYAAGMGIQNDWRIGYYLSFAAKLVFMFGAVFELPVIVVPLIKLDILTYERMKRTRAYALITCFAAALLLAPAPDPGTMILMAAPMYLLYELCILFAWHESGSTRRKHPPVY